VCAPAANRDKLKYHQLYLELKTAITQGQLVAVAGIVGCDKTTLLQRVQAELVREREILVARSLAVDKPTVCLDVIALVASSYRYNRGVIEQRVAH